MRIGIIENDKKLRELLQIIAELGGHEVPLATPISDFVAPCHANCPLPLDRLDLIIIDVDRLGSKILSHVMAHSCTLPLVLISSDAFAAERELGTLIKQEVLQKPFRTASLLNAISTASALDKRKKIDQR